MSDMSGTGGGNEGAGDGGGEPQDVTALISGLGEQFSSRFDELGSTLTSRLDALEQAGQHVEEEEGEEGEEEREELLPTFSDEDFDERGGVTLEAVSREIQRIAREEAQRETQELRQERDSERQQVLEAQENAEYDAMEERYPGLQDPEIQNEVLDLAADAVGPKGRITPKSVEVAYLAYEAQKAAAGEIPAGSQKEIKLERGGGAGPAAASSDDRAASIVKATTGSHFRLGRG